MAADPISWDVATRVAIRVAGRDPLSDSYLYASLQPDFDELVSEAEELVAEATGLRSLSGPARARVTDRGGWVEANVASFRRLLRPVTDKLGPRLDASTIAPVGRVLTGVQLGTMLGWMSTRVLGQYDLLVLEDERPDEQDIVYFVGPNVLALEQRFGFPPREFRLWLALHEVTHRAQFTGVPWMRGHYLSMVNRLVDSIDPDPRAFVEALKRAADSIRHGRNPLDDGGVVGLLAGPEQFALLQRLQGLMTLLEGHGDVTMDRAGEGRIPSSERFSQVLRERRANVRGPVRLLQQLIGLEAKLKQYEEGERFIAAVEAEGGPDTLAVVWQSPDLLPSLSEIADPAAWMARVHSPAAPLR